MVKRIVMTGGLGFVGQNLAHHLRTKPEAYRLTALDWFDAAQEDEKSLFDEIYQGCFTHPAALDLIAQADVVVHLAARTTVQESIDNPMATFTENVEKTQTLLEHLRLHAPETKVIFASTGGAIIGDYDGAIDESVPPCPLSPYGASKLAVEGLLSAYRGSFGLNAASLRFSNVYGPNSRRKSSVVAAYCKMYLRDGVLKVNGDGQQTRDYIYVADIAEVIYRVIEKDAQGVFQLGTGRGTSILEIVEHFRDCVPEAAPVIMFAPALTGEVRHNKANIGHLQQTLDFTPQWDLQSGIAATLDWFRTELKARD
ncbi:MAG: UDP-glucose 4-epimerase [Paracoccaceae bacterium]|jgi:UDP-glucose 4-epimerase